MQTSIKIYSTSEWNARPPKAFAPQTVPKYIVIHHTAAKPVASTLDKGKKLARSIQNYHMDHNGWIDSGLNFLNTTTGQILEGRHGTLNAVRIGRCVRSAHAGNKLANESPGIENEGLFTTAHMPEIQWIALVNLCAYLCKSLHISPSQIRG